MKLKLLGIGIASILTLVGCQGTNDNQEGAMDRDNNIEQTRFNDTNENNRMTDDNRMNPLKNDDRDNMNKDTDKNEERYDVSKEAADKITDKVAEIDNAYVLTTKNNAYVAAVLDNDNNKNDGKQDTGKDLTDEVKKEIGDIVKSVDKDIDHVYVTTNPDFADLTNNYTNDMNNNKPIRGMFDQIGNMIERVFPQNKK